MTCSASGSVDAGSRRRRAAPAAPPTRRSSGRARRGRSARPPPRAGRGCGPSVRGRRRCRSGTGRRSGSALGRHARYDSAETCINKEKRACCLPSARTCCSTGCGTDGRIVAKDLAAELGVSEDSVRRDLRELAAAGLCQRVYGGALPVSPAIADYAARRSVGRRRARQRVAARGRRADPARAATVILDGGTTALAVAQALPPDLRGDRRHAQPDRRGRARRAPDASRSTCSAGGCSSTRRSPAAPPRSRPPQAVNADLFLLGVTGVHAEAGLTTGDADEAAMKRTLAAPRRRHLRARPARRRSAPPRRSPWSAARRGRRDHHRRAAHRCHA